MKNILVLSKTNNVHADAVEQDCLNHGAQVQRINLDFSQKIFPSIILGDSTEYLRFDAIFLHHAKTSAPIDWFQDSIENQLFRASWNSLFLWLEDNNPNAIWVNRMSEIIRHRSVFGQMIYAKSLGIRVPRTLFTNNWLELRSFAQGDKVALKAGNLGINLPGQRILTSLVGIDDFSSDDLKSCPSLFQEYIEKDFELRIHVIGNHVLSCRIDSQENEKTKIDWRDYDLENTPHSVFELSSEMKKICIQIVEHMGLSFGIIDAIITPDQEFVFLECNAQGHWLWIEDLIGLPITRSITEYLLQ